MLWHVFWTHTDLDTFEKSGRPEYRTKSVPPASWRNWNHCRSKSSSRRYFCSRCRRRTCYPCFCSCQTRIRLHRRRRAEPDDCHDRGCHARCRSTLAPGTKQAPERVRLSASGMGRCRPFPYMTPVAREDWASPVLCPTAIAAAGWGGGGAWYGGSISDAGRMRRRCCGR